MAYRYSKKYTPRQGKGGYRRRSVKSRPTKGSSKTLDKYVEAKVKSALSRASRGPPRSVTVRALPSEVNRSLSTPEFVGLTNSEWPAYLRGALAERKYALLPVTELIPSQRSPTALADDGQRGHDSVFIKGVCLRMSLCHAEGIRLMLFAFRNGNRRDCPPSTTSRPFVIMEDGKEVPREVHYEVLTKEKLNFIVDPSEVQNSVRHLGYHDGPFAVRHDLAGDPAWKSVDGTAFTSRVSKAEGKPIGNVQVRLDAGSATQCGAVCNMNLGTSSMRTFKTPGSRGLGSDWVGMRYRQVEFYVTLNQNERFPASGSRAVNERPLELFLGFDGPPPFEIHASDEDSACAAVTGMDMEVYYDFAGGAKPDRYEIFYLTQGGVCSLDEQEYDWTEFLGRECPTLYITLPKKLETQARLFGAMLY
ncbi:hypothetical protein VN97_g3112 [Penicillium thymicola]|uniref:Uncharacterized protein n=1 Tax=Penicillium thymicola TaxID=293382 RepID=A0AAI9TMS3_PENTH|nr:hypothetical protein VN97_g3112 [Penicillium thymicola]